MSAHIQIKNCGLKTPADMDCAIGSGANFLGFVLHESSIRHIRARDASALTRHLPASVQSVAVMVNPSDEALKQTLDEWHVSMIQLHGSESPERCAEIRERYGLPVIKAISIKQRDDVAEAAQYHTAADYLLFDTKHPTLAGGTGEAFDWQLLHGLQTPLPWFLSGGLHAGNIEQALQITGARRVDVSSGIEGKKGVKDHYKMREFNQLAAGVR